MQVYGLRHPPTPLPLFTASRSKHRSPTSCAATKAGRSSPSPAPALSVSDEELAARGLRVRRSPGGLDLEALNSVFARVGFPRRDEARIRLALEHTDAVVWVEEVKSADGTANGNDGVCGAPVAFARATGDGVFNAVVWDVVVEPELQGTGLGRAVMERLVADLRRHGITNIALYAEPQVVGFYLPLGFTADPDGVKGMVYSRRKKKR
ncbi:putative N-acetyltransferase ycf52 [Apostasia shenzhenica]|uniref:aralkylamine N-acetyltransferase n=1 Tax=Apostasia shenzhenica TaxID=1088818 RepID=A0A2I0APQ1_9ASPA|nr:putative N-acetyltransferase ycf52 [Apostasia shenzhenica]